MDCRRNHKSQLKRWIILRTLAVLAFLPVALPTDLGSVDAQVAEVRRVYAPLLDESTPWAKSGLLWFGKAGVPGGPGQNYVDVRVGYTAEELRIFVNVEDYYIWYDTSATPTSDLTRYDAVAVYLDTAHDRSTSPQLDDRLFLRGLCLYGCGDGSSYWREARGTGSEWDFGWQGAWDASNTFASWSCDPGPNSNECTIDYGWWSFIDIPWSTLGSSGPPAEGTVWGLGVVLYDRDDQPPAGNVPAESWPETLLEGSPSTWGELAIGTSSFVPSPAVQQGTATIRRGLGSSIVEDAWVGGGGTCSGGHEGNPNQDNYGDSTSLFVANQSLIADMPCFSKSYLRFHLDPVPAGKTIISAKLGIYHWGNANPANAYPSLIWLFTVDEDWAEDTLTWNNAPLAKENLSATWVDVCTQDDPCDSPGVRYEWDATKAVTKAYAAGTPLNIALYTSDTRFDSSKYFSSSEVGDWNAQARPTLTIVWGAPLAGLTADVQPLLSKKGDVVTYSFSTLGNGEGLTLTTDLPSEVSAPQSIEVSSVGSVDYDADQHRVVWQGAPDVGEQVDITVRVTIQAIGPRVVNNTAVLTGPEELYVTASTSFYIDAVSLFLPIVASQGY